MNFHTLLLPLFFILSLFHVTHAFVEGLYCGVQSCYDVLGVERDASKSDISKIYRKLARKYHPDVNTTKGATEMFQSIATAYEILRDDEQRKDYDYMLDNPDEAYYHYYQYYKRRLTPKVDVRYVIAVTITVISVLQYLHKGHAYNEAINYAMQNPKFRNQALQIIHKQGLLDNSKKTKNKRDKEDRKREEERVLREIVEDSIDIKGGYSKPSVYDILWVQLICLPYHTVLYVVWFARWIWKFWVLKEEYGDEEKEYMTRKNLGLSANYWAAQDEDSKEEYMAKELWVKENFKTYKADLEEEYRVKMAESGRHKMWRRYMKKGGPGHMTFAED